MAISQTDLALQMAQQLKVLDPSVSAEVGTPERKILDTVAQALAEAQIDITSLDGSLDLDAKLGSSLDRFLALFGFARQTATSATGIATFSRNIPASFDIRIPSGTQIATGASTPSIGASNGIFDPGRITFVTTFETFLTAGNSSIDVPIRATSAGAIGNVAADQIQVFVGQPVLGITSVTNPGPTSGGQDEEGDDELKIRFTNTVFRNLAGTSDQYLALAASTPFTTKANVIGPISRYREYIQVPDVDDASLDDVDADGTGESGNGNPGEYTTALSTIPYSKHTYDTVPTFLSNGRLDVNAVFYTDGLDFALNVDSSRDRGDTHRLNLVGLESPLTDPQTANQPNVTLLNVYMGADDAVQSIRPSDILLFEHSYLSDASRNDLNRNILNCVDIYVNGSNDTEANAVVPKPILGVAEFKIDASDRFDANKFRRVGEPDHLPILGNLFSPLYWQPVAALPDEVVVGGFSYIQGVHYWLVEDVSAQGGTVRSRNGIEWSADVKSKTGNDADGGPYTGKRITDLTDADATSLAVDSYLFDRNIPDLQATIEGAKQITTDALVHHATTRYFKLNITVMYNAGVTTSDVNTSIQSAVQSLLSTHYFGQAIQLSDFLQTIHNVPGVDNVRWTREVDPTVDRVEETSNEGAPRLGLIFDRVLTGRTPVDPEGPVNEIQQFYLTGDPNGGSYQLGQDSNVTAPIAFDADATAVEAALAAATPTPIAATVVGAGSPTNAFWVTLGSSPQTMLYAFSTDLTSVTRVFNNDFFLKDNELPSLPEGTIDGDDVPGLVIRPRAQQTWTKGG